MLVFNNRIIDKSHMDLDTDIWHLVPKYLYLASKYWYLSRRKFYPKNAQIATDMFLRQNAENIVCVLIMKLHLSLPNLTWGKIIPGKLVVLGKVAGKKSVKSVVFCQTRGGGVFEGKQKTKPQVCKCVFLQWACRIILGPQKHVLHLVWSANVLSTAIGTTLKIARGSQIMGKRRAVL